MFAALAGERAGQYLMIDSTIVRANQRAAAAKGGARDRAPGRARGGLTNKVQMLADALDRPPRFIITPGQAGDITRAPALLQAQSGKAVLAGNA